MGEIQPKKPPEPGLWCLKGIVALCTGSTAFGCRTCDADACVDCYTTRLDPAAQVAPARRRLSPMEERMMHMHRPSYKD